MEEILKKLNSPKEIFLLALLSLCIISIRLTYAGLTKKHAIHRNLVPIYFILIAVQIILSYYEMFSSPKIPAGKTSIMNISAYFFIALEFILFSILLRNAIQSIILRKILFALTITFPFAALIVWTNTKSSAASLSIISTSESVVLIPICLYFFIELLQRPPVLMLSKEPYFWITTGILLLLISITPFYLLFGLIKPNPAIQIVDHIAYIIIVAIFTKSYYVSSET